LYDLRQLPGRQRLSVHRNEEILACGKHGAIAVGGLAHFIEIGEKPNTVITERKTEIDKVEKAYGMEVVPTKNAPVEFNNVELQQIMKYVSDNYNIKVEFKNNDARTIRFYLQWEADNTLQEIIDKINHFEKVRLTLNEETITIE
jgi:hypothetical protein